MADIKDEEAEFFTAMCETQGVACSTVKDGHVLMFKLSFLKEIVEKNSDKEKLLIFIKRPDFKD